MVARFTVLLPNSAILSGWIRPDQTLFFSSARVNDTIRWIGLQSGLKFAKAVGKKKVNLYSVYVV